MGDHKMNKIEWEWNVVSTGVFARDQRVGLGYYYYLGGGDPVIRPLTILTPPPLQQTILYMTTKAQIRCTFIRQIAGSRLI